MTRLKRTRGYMLAKNAAKRLMPGDYSWPPPVDDSETMPEASPVVMPWPAGVPKPRVGLVPDRDVCPYWTKYRRFLQANDIGFALYDVHRSTWLDEARDYDVIVWRPMSFPAELEECRRKIYVLERRLGKLCYPSYAESLIYEDKILQHDLLAASGVPLVDTFVSHSRSEAISHMGRRSYPAVWKIAAASGSFGVELVGSARAGVRRARRVFSFSGRRTYWPYVAQKDYIYVQSLQPNQGFDVRVIVIADKVLGYYRDVPPGDFRASGMGLLRREALPPAAIAVARRATNALGAPFLAVDCLVDPSGEQVFVIEVSSFTQITVPEQLMVNGQPGMLVGDDLEFVPVRVWPQELALEHVLRTRWIGERRGG